MRQLEQMNDKLEQCDQDLFIQLSKRLSYMKELARIKKDYKLAVLTDPGEEERKYHLSQSLEHSPHGEELSALFDHICKVSSTLYGKEFFMNNIYLIGFMGAGKSTIANILENRLGLNRIEMDQEIVDLEKKSIPEIFEQKGEEYFRQIETELLSTYAGRQSTIISCGGGIVVKEENTRLMRESGKIVFLKASPETIYERVKDDTNRPLLAGNMNVEYISALMDKRRVLYEQVADLIIETDGKSGMEIGEELVVKIQQI